VVQAGKFGEYVGELVVKLDSGGPKSSPTDCTLLTTRFWATAEKINKFDKAPNEVVFASRGYRIDQPLAVAPQDLPNTFTDIVAGTPLTIVVTDAFRWATKADMGFTATP
jgi:5'-nucleotidase / UDP-sugar diphosphatase